MKKIPTLFQRSEDRRTVIDVVTPGCEWVLMGQGEATRKYDGTCVMHDAADAWWARREVKAGGDYPHGFVLEELDQTTGKAFGWEPIEQSGFARWHAEALSNPRGRRPEGTYELCGPKIQGNPEGFHNHAHVRHADAQVIDRVPLTFSGLRDWLPRMPYEGIVWHHPDGRMCKLKKRDFPKPT